MDDEEMQALADELAAAADELAAVADAVHARLTPQELAIRRQAIELIAQTQQWLEAQP